MNNSFNLIISILFCLLANAQQPKFIDLFDTSMNSSVSCYRIPSLVTAPNGTIIAAIDERNISCGDLKWNRDINIVLRKSFDNGETWSEIEKIIDYPLGESASDPSMIVDKLTNEIFLFYNYMNLDKEKNVYYLKFIKSADNGESWSSPRDITNEITHENWRKDFMFITSGRGVQTSNGTLLHTLVNLNKGTHVFGSKDHGKNWFLIDNPVKPGDESKIIELSDNNWMINSRVNAAGLRFTHTSPDKGKNWFSNPNSDLNDPGCNASLIRYNFSNNLEKSVLLFSNANNSKERKNMTISISYDNGKTWPNTKTIYSGEAAYSSMTILKNGEIGLFFEKDNYSKNVFVKFSLDWLSK